MVDDTDSRNAGLIVLGMHRSGTSALAGALRLCGAWLGEDSELTFASSENPKGFWERRDVRTICDSLLHAAGADWWKVAAFEENAIPHAAIAEQRRAFRRVVAELELHGVWAIKEPRLCLLFQVLRPLVPEAVCIHVVRNPLDVAQSLRARNGFGVAEGLALWEMYNVKALQASSEMPRLIVAYERLVAKPEETLSAVLRNLASLGITGLAMPATHELEQFITPSLRHQSDPDGQAIDFLLPSQQDLWTQLQSGEALHADSPKELSVVARQYLRDLESRKGSLDQVGAKATATQAKLASKVKAKETEVGELRTKLAEHDTQLEKITAQLRSEAAQLRSEAAQLRSEAAQLRSEAAQLRSEQARTDNLTAKLRANDVRLRKQARAFKLRIGNLEAQLAAVYASHSWRSTAPLRAVSRLAKWTLRNTWNTFRLIWWLGTGQFSRAAAALLPRYRRHVPARIRLLIPRGLGNSRRRLHAYSSERDAKILKSRFFQELQKIEPEASPDFANALRQSADQLSHRVERLRLLTDRPLVSVIMPTHNRAAIIDGAIATVLEQDYPNWELLVCDDASTDDTEEIVNSFFDNRIKYLKLTRQGAAAARNAGLENATGSIIAYLDSDNFWHSSFLGTAVLSLLENPGHSCVYTDFIDFRVHRDGRRKCHSFKHLPFNYEHLLTKPYIDLNSFAHRRELYECFGGFDERLKRRQDYDLILKYTWLRDPLHVPCLTTLYQRNDRLAQITREQREDRSCVSIINSSLDGYLKNGLPIVRDRPVGRVTILSWDLCRNHFSKAFALAEALSGEYEVQLISFRFFDEKIFAPLEDVVPAFDTLYLPGGEFPDFFRSMERALTAITGDILYVVKPRLPSLGLALLANYQRGIPIALEINDLETVVGSPSQGTNHAEKELGAMDPGAPELLNPYSDLWSQLMHPLAREIPVLTTHNHAIDAEFDRRCLYMRNIKDEQVYDPAAYDRNLVRSGLGFEPEDRVIFFGGLIRKHKGVHELVELVERLDDPRYKLLFAASRPTPDQKKLVERYGNRVRVLPPQNRESMARINYAADLVILWLDPDVPASRFQMPYKATDAFAMGPSVIANDVSDLGLLGRQGYFHLVPFGDWEAITRIVGHIFENPEETAAKRAACRRLYLRQFSYAAARSNFLLAARRALQHKPATLSAAERFSRYFNDFYRTATQTDHDFIPVQRAANLHGDTGSEKVDGYGESEEDASIVMIDARDLARLTHDDAAGVAVIMPSIDAGKALRTARVLVRRAGMNVSVLVVEDSLRQGFVRTLNAAAQRLNVAYLVYLAEDAFPGLDWLRTAYEVLEKTGKGLLAFNDGKWGGRIASFGMVRMQWISSVYGGPILFPGYRAHKADNELTVIARVMNDFVYEPTATLVELDSSKVFEGGEGLNGDGQAIDRSLFYKRFHGNFDSRFPGPAVTRYEDEYFNLRKRRAERDESYQPTDDAIRQVNIQNIRSLSWRNPEGIAVIMPCVDPEAAHATAQLLVRRAGIAARVYTVEDTLRQGFIATLNATAAQLDVKYIVYLAEDAFPGENWLRTAHQRMEETGKGLLAFNCGKWQGRIAAFGMVRKSWVQQIYGAGAILHTAYRAHKADNELTVIARATEQFVYEPESVLIENDPGKTFKEDPPEDKAIFHRRFQEGFDGLVSLKRLKPLAEAYFIPLQP
jgi:glycosyltransferase involved in cell wall biosynthesis